MNENLLELLADEIEVTQDDQGEEPSTISSTLGMLNTSFFEVRNNQQLSAEGQRGVLHSFGDIGNVTWEDGTPQEKIWLRSAMQEAVNLGLSRDRIQTALESG